MGKPREIEMYKPEYTSHDILPFTSISYSDIIDVNVINPILQFSGNWKITFSKVLTNSFGVF